MNILLILAVSLVLLALAVRWYGRGISRWIRLNDAEPTPAVAKRDDRDYIPTKLHVVFAHHFSAIAGAGPIIGPTVAALYGFVPAWMWIILGGIFFGAVHDFTALFVSVKEGGKSMAEITRKTLGGAGFVLFISFTIMMLLLVTSAFLNATAMSLTSMWPLDKLGLAAGQTVLRTVTNTSTGAVEGVIGGIASTSVIIITLFSPLLGWAIIRRGRSTLVAYIIAAVVAIGSVAAGFYVPVSLPPQTWMVIISIYCLFAAGLPVWLILQPRDFINVQLLYGGMLMLVLGVMAGGLSGTTISFPATNVAQGVKSLGLLWPMMFITIACGAISGFHALVGGGTTSKQVSLQSYTRKVGYGAMVLESILALLVLLAIASGLKYADYLTLVHPVAGKGNPILAFSLSVGFLMQKATGLPVYLGAIFGILMVEGFVITSLDVAVRFIRYLLEELWAVVFTVVPAPLRNPWVNSGIAVIGMWALAAQNTFSALWPIFGSANQLLAALTLITVSVWLALRGLRNWFTVIPALFMTATTVASLVLLLITKYLPARNYILVVASVMLLALAVALAVIAVGKAVELIGNRKGQPAAAG
jgi:carbon starvation protein